MPDALLYGAIALTSVGGAGRGRRAADDVAAAGAGGDHAARGAAAARRGSWRRCCWRPSRASAGCGCRSSSTCRPGPPSRCWRAACSRWSRRRGRGSPRVASRRRVALAACGAARRAARREAPPVVATTTVIADWARAVGGDRASVYQVLRPNTDPHEYEPRPSDVRADRRREGWCSRTATASTTGWPTSSRRPTAARPSSTFGGPAAAAAGRGRGERGLAFDPHWWHDPRNARARRGGDPRRAGEGRPRPRAARTARTPPRTWRALEATDAAVAACLDRVPPASASWSPTTTRSATSRPATASQVVGAVIPSQSTQAQPSAGDLADLADRSVRETGVKAVFPEESLSARSRAPDRAGDGRARRPDAVRRRARRDAARAGRRTSACCSPTPTRWPTASAAAPSAARRMTGAPLVEAHDLAVGYDGRPVLRGLKFTVAAGRAGRRAGPERRRQVDAVPGGAGPAGAARRHARVAGRVGVLPQTERSRLDYPVSALDVAMMGTLSRLPWWRRPGRARAPRRTGALERSASPTAPATVRRALRRPAPARAAGPGARAGGAGCCCWTSRSAAWTRPAPRARWS